MSSPPHSLNHDRLQDVRRFYRLTAWIYDPTRRWQSEPTSEAESELDALFAKNLRSDSRFLGLGPGIRCSPRRKAGPSPIGLLYAHQTGSSTEPPRIRGRKLCSPR